MTQGARQTKEEKKYYISSYGTKDCTYHGKKRGRKTMEEKEQPILLKVERKKIILYFD